VRKLERLLPRRLRHRLLAGPSVTLRLLRVLMQAVLRVVPQSLWYMRHLRELWATHIARDKHGEQLAREHLLGTDLVPEQISFPPVRVNVGGWLGYLTVDHATERVEATLLDQIASLAQDGEWAQVEVWLARLLETRRTAWSLGIFSVDAHLKNYGITENRVVLIDPGGLTTQWSDVHERLEFEQGMAAPHVRLGLGRVLAPRPDIADRFDADWKRTVSVEGVLKHWPSD
jgi:hypothetical protein